MFTLFIYLINPSRFISYIAAESLMRGHKLNNNDPADLVIKE